MAAKSSWAKDFPDESGRKAWTHKLGNLALLVRTKNSKVSNLPFAEKKTRYFPQVRLPLVLLS